MNELLVQASRPQCTNTPTLETDLEERKKKNEVSISSPDGQGAAWAAVHCRAASNREWMDDMLYSRFETQKERSHAPVSMAAFSFSFQCLAMFSARGSSGLGALSRA